MKLKKIHHIAVICSDYTASKVFYTEILGLKIISEVYREERKSFKLDLSLNGDYQIELFSFPASPPRPSFPEACGLRHLAFEIDDINSAVAELKIKGIPVEAVRTDEYTGKKFFFFSDPDGLPIELYES
ncbi:VOC family protein [Daejeonella sp. H1SJ63]|uniref:SMU1112c/YaeR family gloxylase I-like metalloprotein n=1 Tax=Daejeonella sp. H1SJ63 TaxID=3034145 RepID=UPI0023ECE925|nr:VOC family protein [Daejeonella sp. H1SJ63]